MYEQQPTPLSELVFLFLFLGSVTYVLAITLLAFIIVRIGKVSVKKMLGCLALFVIISIFGGLLFWLFWPFSFDIMLGSINLPALLSILITGPVSLKIFGYSIFPNRNRKPA